MQTSAGGIPHSVASGVVASSEPQRAVADSNRQTPYSGTGARILFQGTAFFGRWRSSTRGDTYVTVLYDGTEFWMCAPGQIGLEPAFRSKRGARHAAGSGSITAHPDWSGASGSKGSESATLVHFSFHLSSRSCPPAIRRLAQLSPRRHSGFVGSTDVRLECFVEAVPRCSATCRDLYVSVTDPLPFELTKPKHALDTGNCVLVHSFLSPQFSLIVRHISEGSCGVHSAERLHLAGECKFR